MRVVILVVGGVFLGVKFLKDGASTGFIWSALSVLSAVLLSFGAEWLGHKTYYCRYCGRQVDLERERCECGAPILTRRHVSLDSVPVVSEPVIVRPSKWVQITVSLCVVLIGAWVWMSFILD